MKYLLPLFRFLYFANTGVIFFLIWQCLNFLQIDLAGHVASAAQFSRAGLHAFSDRMFLGYSHNLFYPPLEDFILTLLHYFMPENFFKIYKIYLTCIVSAYVGMIWLTARNFKSLFAFSFYAFAMLYLLNVEKPDLLVLQGMGFVDLLLTGLSSQVLAGIFLFLILKEISKPSRHHLTILMVACTLAILSHIVVGFVCVVLVALRLLQVLSIQESIKKLLLIFSACAFYLIPFLTDQSYQYCSQIFLKNEPWAAFAVSLLGLVFFWRQSAVRIFLGFATLLFALLTWIAELETLKSHLPRFHYYRFEIIAYYLSAIGLAQAGHRSMKTLKDLRSLVSLVLATSFIIILIMNFNVQKIDVGWNTLKRTRVDIQNVGNLDFDRYGRFLTFGKSRASDTGIDSILSTLFPNFRSTKGLFWESSYTNTLQTSFLATLMSPPVVLDYFYYHHYPCNIQKCFIDRYSQIYNVKGFIGNISAMSFLEKYQTTCYEQMINGGTSYQSFQQTGELKIDQTAYPIYKLTPKKGGDIPSYFTTDAVEIIDPKKFQILKDDRTQFHREVMEAIYDDCQKNLSSAWNRIFVLPSEKASLDKMLTTHPTPKIRNDLPVGVDLVKVSEQEYSFTLPENDTWFLLKLAPNPNMKILDEKNSLIPILKGMPYTYGVGHGKLRVLFERTWVFKLSYFLSFFTIIGLLLYAIKRKFKIKHFSFMNKAGNQSPFRSSSEKKSTPMQ